MSVKADALSDVISLKTVRIFWPTLLIYEIWGFVKYITFCDEMDFIIVSKGAKIRNRYNQVPHLTQGTNGKVSNSQLYTTNQSQEVSPFPAGVYKAHNNRRAQGHNKHKTEKNIKKSTKEVPPWNGQ